METGKLRWATYRFDPYDRHNLFIYIWVYYCAVDQDDSNSGSEKKKKRRSRWGDSETEKSIVMGLPVVVPQGLTKEQEEQYLRMFIYLLRCCC